jgi:hypothetical protein
MAATLSASIIVSIDAALKELTDTLGAARSDVVDLGKTIVFANGSGAGQASLMYRTRYSLGPSAGQDYDLNGVLETALGDAFDLAKLKLILVASDAANLNNVLVSRSAVNGVPWASVAGDAVIVAPGGLLLLANPSAAGYTVTAGTGDLLTLTNAAGTNTVTGDLLLIGA